jgi:hypothetical protein
MQIDCHVVDFGVLLPVGEGVSRTQASFARFGHADCWVRFRAIISPQDGCHLCWCKCARVCGERWNVIRERQGRAGRQGVLGGVQGAESLFLWRAIGGAVLTLVPATAYSLKVGRALP